MSSKKENKNIIPWIEIKAKYLLGSTPKQLADKYNLTSKQIRDKASREKWKYKKGALVDKIDEEIGNQILQTELDRNAMILSINDLALGAVKDYFENGDYKRCLVETTKPFMINDQIQFDLKGRPIMIKTVEIAEIPFINAPVLKSAIDGLAKANETSRKNEGLDKSDQGEIVEPQFNTIKGLNEDLI